MAVRKFQNFGLRGPGDLDVYFDGYHFGAHFPRGLTMPELAAKFREYADRIDAEHTNPTRVNQPSPTD